MGAVFWKELADYLGSKRFIILFALVALAGLWAVFVAGRTIRSDVANAPTEFVFLRLFTTSSGLLPSFVAFLGFFGPLIGLVLGFDTISGERSRGTLSRVLSQPVYRDAVINGKFLAGLTTIGLVFLAMFLIITGLGMRMLGFPPNLEEGVRIALFLVSSIIYIGFWLGVSMLFSVLFDRPVFSALVSIGLWLFFAFFILMIAGSLADFAVRDTATPELMAQHEQVQRLALRFSPSTLFQEATGTLLTPTVRALGPVLVQQTVGLIPGPLPLSQSLLLVWPHLVSLVALTAIAFAIAYLRFMRQEIRA